MAAIKAPTFQQTQHVQFIDGEGVVRNFKAESGSWMYIVEMALGIEPDFGRVGGETMMILTEEDLCAA